MTRPSTVLARLAPFAVLVWVAGCTPGEGLPPMPDYTASRYQLGSGDTVRIITFGEDQMTGEFRVDEQGEIAVPLLGEVKCAGLTTQQLQQRITAELKQRKVLTDPSVSIQVLAYRPVFVLGEVARPGQYPYQPGMTMLTAVAVAGGFTYRAVEGYADDIRTSDTRHASEGRIMPRSLIAPGDVVKVFQRRF